MRTVKKVKTIKTMGVSPTKSTTSRSDLTRKSVKTFVTKLGFNKLLAEGDSPEVAARKVGVNVPYGRRLSVSELTDLKTKGEITGKRRGI